MIETSAIAACLLDVGAVKIDPVDSFTWASGWNSPIYCDNRKLLSFVEERNLVKDQLRTLVSTQFPAVEVLAGVATAGIAWGALIADIMELPYLYVRPKPKEHGLGNQIEGVVTKSKKVVIIEDLISTGKSSLQVCEVLKTAGLRIEGLVSIFNYGFPEAIAAFTQAGVPFFSLTNYNSLLSIALERKMVSESEIKTLLNWQESPSTWKK